MPKKWAWSKGRKDLHHRDIKFRKIRVNKVVVSGAVYVRRASPLRTASPPKIAGLYFMFTWRASPSRRARHVGTQNSNPIVLH